jgi:hypothetical protein
MDRKKKREDALRRGRSQNPELVLARIKLRLKDAEREKKLALHQVTELHEMLDFALGIAVPKKVKPIRVPRKRTSKRRACACAAASDWHIEEKVTPESIGGFPNHYDLAESKARSERFFRGYVELVESHSNVFDIEDGLIWFGGDVITGRLRNEDLTVNLLSPTMAIMRWLDYAAAGVDYVLKHSSIKRLQIECSYGNHDRINDKVWIAREAENSYAWIAYHQLAQRYKDEPRVTFNIPRSGIHYSEVYGLVLRWHHGHYIRYKQGIMGLGVPAGKKIAGWDKARLADLTIIGHYHVLGFYPGLITNGSLIGFNPYAMSLGCTPEDPQQAFWLIDSERGVCMQTPIWVAKK